MLFIVRFEDVYADQPDRLPERERHMPAHLAFLSEHTDKMLAAGALRDILGGVPSGGIWILNVESKAAAEAFYKLDPFWTAGLRRSVHVSHWQGPSGLQHSATAWRLLARTEPDQSAIANCCTPDFSLAGMNSADVLAHGG